MTATPLSSGPVMGVLSASGSSPVFASVAGQETFVDVFLSPLARGPNTTSTLYRSADGGSTWSAVSQGIGTPFTDTQSYLYYIAISINAGSALYLASAAVSDPYLSIGTIQVRQSGFEGVYIMEPGGDFTNERFLNMTTAQLLALYRLKSTPLTLGQIASPLTLYKQLREGAVATLSVPSGAQTGFANGGMHMNGTNRAVRASSVQVLSIVDPSGKPLSSATPLTVPAVTYSVGSTLTAYDLYAGTAKASTGAFGDATYTAGIYGFTTLLEAACYSQYPVNLAALGL